MAHASLPVTQPAYVELHAVHGSGAVAVPSTARLTSLGYSGEHFDARAQQQYLRARWYDPANGRFNRLDPFAGNMQDPQSLHKYAYVHVDPVGMTDPTGMFGLGGMSVSMSIGGTLGNVSNEANFSAHSAAIAASNSKSAGEFVQRFFNQLQQNLEDGFYSGIPVFGTLYDIYQLGQAAFSYLGDVLDLSGETPAPTTTTSSMASSAAAAAVQVGRRGFIASRYFTKLRSGMQITSVRRVINGQENWIPLLGTAQTTSGNHAAIVNGLTRNLAKKANTELVAMNRSLSTVLRAVGGTHAPWAKALGVNLYIPINFGNSARALDRYQPNVIAIQGSNVIIREVASGSQMTGRFVNPDYLEWLREVRKVAATSQLSVRVLG